MPDAQDIEHQQSRDELLGKDEDTGQEQDTGGSETEVTGPDEGPPVSRMPTEEEIEEAEETGKTPAEVRAERLGYGSAEELRESKEERIDVIKSREREKQTQEQQKEASVEEQIGRGLPDDVPSDREITQQIEQQQQRQQRTQQFKQSITTGFQQNVRPGKGPESDIPDTPAAEAIGAAAEEAGEVREQELETRGFIEDVEEIEESVERTEEGEVKTDKVIITDQGAYDPEEIENLSTVTGQTIRGVKTEEGLEEVSSKVVSKNGVEVKTWVKTEGGWIPESQVSKYQDISEKEPITVVKTKDNGRVIPKKNYDKAIESKEQAEKAVPELEEAQTAIMEEDLSKKVIRYTTDEESLQDNMLIEAGEEIVEKGPTTTIPVVGEGIEYISEQVGGEGRGPLKLLGVGFGKFSERALRGAERMGPLEEPAKFSAAAVGGLEGITELPGKAVKGAGATYEVATDKETRQLFKFGALGLAGSQVEYATENPVQFAGETVGTALLTYGITKGAGKAASTIKRRFTTTQISKAGGGSGIQFSDDFAEGTTKYRIKTKGPLARLTRGKFGSTKTYAAESTQISQYLDDISQPGGTQFKAGGGLTKVYKAGDDYVTITDRLKGIFKVQKPKTGISKGGLVAEKPYGFLTAAEKIDELSTGSQTTIASTTLTSGAGIEGISTTYGKSVVRSFDEPAIDFSTTKTYTRTDIPKRVGITRVGPGRQRGFRTTRVGTGETIRATRRVQEGVPTMKTGTATGGPGKPMDFGFTPKEIVWKRGLTQGDIQNLATDIQDIYEPGGVTAAEATQASLDVGAAGGGGAIQTARTTGATRGVAVPGGQFMRTPEAAMETEEEITETPSTTMPTVRELTDLDAISTTNVSQRTSPLVDTTQTPTTTSTQESPTRQATEPTTKTIPTQTQTPTQAVGIMSMQIPKPVQKTAQKQAQKQVAGTKIKLTQPTQAKVGLFIGLPTDKAPTPRSLVSQPETKVSTEREGRPLADIIGASRVEFEFEKATTPTGAEKDPVTGVLKPTQEEELDAPGGGIDIL